MCRNIGDDFLILIVSCFLLCSDCQHVNDDHIQTALDVKRDQSFLKLVWDNGVEHYVRSWECPDGVWGEDYLLTNPPKCACVKGAFIATKALCDEEFEILTGDDHCFDISKSKIRKLTPLTGQSGLKGRSTTVFRRDAPYVARLISPTPTSSVNEPVNYVFRLNDPIDLSIYAGLPDGSLARLGCLPAQANSSEPTMQVAELPDCASEFRGPRPWCGTEIPHGTYVSTIKVGSKWGPKSSGSGTQGSCPSAKSSAPKKGRRRRGASPADKNKEKEQIIKPLPICDVFNSTVIIEEPEQGSISVQHFIDWTEYPSHDFHTASQHQSEVNEQTMLIAQDVIDLHLNMKDEKLTPKTRLKSIDDIPAYKFIQLSRVIMERVCPQEHVPPFVLAFMTRLFRIIHIDTANKYPYPEHLQNQSVTNTKILEALTSCRDQIPENITSFLPNATCPDAGFTGGEVNSGSKIYLDGKNMTTMPDHVKFDPSSMDMVLETMWKMMLLSHYYCAPNFTNPLYHSEFTVKYEAFFNNPLLLYRWYHPGASNQVMKVLLSAFNLRNFAASVDRCVSIANGMSKYKMWLRRPADSLNWKRKFPASKESEEAAKNANGDDDDGPSTEGPPMNIFGGHHSRKKRYYYQNNIWEEKAYCLRNSKDVVTEVRSASILDCVYRPAWYQNTDA